MGRLGDDVWELVERREEKGILSLHDDYFGWMRLIEYSILIQEEILVIYEMG